MKADLHVHTRFSPDSLAGVGSIFRAAKKKGLDAVAITDHDSCQAWDRARKESRKTGVSFIPGVEVSAGDEQGNFLGHVLCLFLSEPVKSSELHELYDEVKSQDGIVSVAHPFDPYRYGIGERIEEFAGYYDAVEAFNSHSRDQAFDERAKEFAREKGLPVTAGSDAHVAGQVGMGRVVGEASDLLELKKRILEKKVKVEGEYRSLGLKVMSGPGKIKSLFWHS